MSKKLQIEQFEGVSKRLKQLRSIRSLSQKDISQRIGVARAYWSTLETGKRELTGNVIRKLIAEFHISADWLLTGKEFPSQDNSKLNSEDINRKVDSMYMNIVWLIELMTKEFGEVSAYDAYLKGLQSRISSLVSIANVQPNGLDDLLAGLTEDFFQLFTSYFLNKTYSQRRNVEWFIAPENVVKKEAK